MRKPNEIIEVKNPFRIGVMFAIGWGLGSVIAQLLLVFLSNAIVMLQQYLVF